jgi:hypothetical protein
MDLPAATIFKRQYAQVRRQFPQLPPRLPACLVKNLARLTDLKVALSATARECLTLTGAQRRTDPMFFIGLSRAYLQECRSAEDAAAEINRALAGIQPDLAASHFIIDSVTLQPPKTPAPGIEYELDCEPLPVLIV